MSTLRIRFAKAKSQPRTVLTIAQGQQDIRDYIDNERDLYIKDEAELALLLNIKGKRLRHYTARKH